MTQHAYVPTGSEVVQTLPWKWNVQGRIFLIGGLGVMFDAWDVSLNGVLIPLLSEQWDLTSGQAAWIGTANLLGMAIGALFGPQLPIESGVKRLSPQPSPSLWSSLLAGRSPQILSPLHCCGLWPA